MDSFQVIGYYICETVEAPEWLRGVSSRVLSVSGCIGERHPKWECFLGGFRKGKSREYQKALGMDDEQYKALLEAANRLFTHKQIDIDSRFLRLSDAQDLYKKYFFNLPCRVVSISTAPEYFSVLAEEMAGSNSNGSMSGILDDSRCLGCDILGWDSSGFHSFLCNSLEKQLPDAKFNGVGLLENVFSDVTRFAGMIQGQGEPVVWVPCKVGACG